MGHVELVLARDGRFERRYARKRLHAQYRKDPTFRTMFKDEARLAGMVHHPNVVGVLDVGEDAEGPFLIMDFVDGVPLSKIIALTGQTGARLPLQIAARLVLEAARGLAAAHELRGRDGEPLGLVHRDVSPQNILVGFDGSVRVTDFGIAKAMGNASETTAGIIKGTVGYLSPEQLRFEEPDRRSDLFSLGVILFELLSGRRLYPNTKGYDGVRRIMSEPPPDIGHERNDVPAALVELTFQMLAKDRAQRCQSAGDLVSRLEEILAALIDEEGPVELKDFMERHFVAVRAEQAERFAMEIRRLDEAAAHATRAKRRGRTVGLGLLIVAVLVTSALVLHDRTPPTRLPGGPRDFWAGAWHTCASEGSTFYCWGKNNEGQLGLGHTRDLPTRKVVTTVSRPAAVALGFFHTCACGQDGHASCWGRNAEGQLGTGRRTPNESAPVPVSGVSDCVQLAAGNRHTCSRSATGTVRCWGMNRAGQLGRPPVESDPSPAPVEGLAHVAEIDADADFTCARHADGTVSCFGANEQGQLGDGTHATGFKGVRVAGIDDAVELTVGPTFGCVRRRAGPVTCWGDVPAAGTTELVRNASGLVEFAALADTVQITAGARHVCALRRSGEALCWGDNRYGQLGSATRSPSPPVLVDQIRDFVALSAGDQHTCGRHAAGVSCWGLGQTGQLGDGNLENRFYPVSVAGFRP